MRQRRYTFEDLCQYIYNRDGLACQYCGITDPTIEYEIEHIIPMSKQGNDHPANLVVACKGCNSVKRSDVWMPMNFDAITADYPEWRARIQSLAIPAPPRRCGTGMPVAPPPDVRKTYSYRIGARTAEAFDAFARARKQQKGPLVEAALREYMARHTQEGA